MSSNLCSGTVTSGFIDLATFDELEKYMYGGPQAAAYFVRGHRKATWFTQVPVVLSRAAGSPAFDTEWSVSISRAGDYLLHTWLRVTTPTVTANATDDAGDPIYIRWTRNFMHNLISEACLTFNDLVAARFDNYHLDFWTAFTVPAGKRNGYNNMIGNLPELTDYHGTTLTRGATLPERTLNLPLPFFYSRDSGVALPTAALPYNDMRINFRFRRWDELLITTNANFPAGTAVHRCARASDLVNGAPTLGTTQVWANYSIVSNDERKRMACAPRDLLIEQVQTAPRQTFTPSTNSSQSFDIRFSHAIKALFFSVRNTTASCEWSNYTSASPWFLTAGGGDDTVDFSPSGAVDPIVETSLVYENTQRLSQMGSDYFSLVQPYYHAPFIPLETGYHMYSYALDFVTLDPTGSTNFGKLTNVSIAPAASAGSQTAAVGGGAAGSGADWNQTFAFWVTAVNNNIIRVSGGALGQKTGRPKTGGCRQSCDITLMDKQCKYHLLTQC